MAGLLELSDQEFKATMINIDKVDNMQEQMDNISREVEILRKNQIEMLERKNKQKSRMFLMDLLVDWTHLRKESLSKRIYQ